MLFRRAHQARPVRIAAVAFPPGPDLSTICRAVESAAAGHRLDLILLPETFRGNCHPEGMNGPSITGLSELARRHNTYIMCPIDRMNESGRWNSAVLLDRTGQVACIYDKVHLFAEEEELIPARQSGERAITFDADFGRLGFATCFDVNFPDHWRQLADLGAELVVFPSAYAASQGLQAHAINHNYYIISSTQVGDCAAYDITGERLLHRKSKRMEIGRVTLDLDRCLFHVDFNQGPRARQLAAHGNDLRHRALVDEGWFILEAAKPGVSARVLAAEFGLEELRYYRQRIRARAKGRMRSAVPL